MLRTDSPPPYDHVDEEMGKSLISRNEKSLDNDEPAHINHETQIVVQKCSIWFRLFFEIAIRPAWTGFCFGWTLASCAMSVCMIFPPAGIPLMYLVCHSWRVLALTDLLINRWIMKLIYSSQGEDIPESYKKIPKFSPSGTAPLGAMGTLFRLASDKFTLRSLLYLMFVQFTLCIGTMIIFVLMFTFLCCPFTWLCFTKWSQVFNDLQKKIVLVSFWALAWDFELDDVVAE